MNWKMALFTYLVVWCMTLFFLLPVRAVPRLRHKMAWNTLLAAVATLAIHLLLQSGLVPLRNVY